MTSLVTSLMRFLLIFSSLCHFGSSDRVSKKIYVKFDGIGACFRRFNATHQTGCTSSRSGNVGVVYLINSTADLDWLLTNGTQSPYIAVIPSVSFDRDLVHTLADSGKINGIIVMDYNLSTAVLPKAFSSDRSCPNDMYGLYNGDPEYGNCKKVEWNKAATGLSFDDFNFPIYSMTNQTEVDFIIEQCYMQFNKPTEDGRPRDYPLCAAELKDVMDGAKDTVTCMRRSTHITNFNPDKYCDPLGDRNVISTFKHVNRTEDRPEKSIILAAARLDALSMFSNMYPGADGSVTGFVALLAAAEALSKGPFREDIHASNNDIMFTFFQGEAYDYIGSSRMVYEMKHNRFPQNLPLDWDGVAEINLTHIAHFVEVSQVGLQDDGSLWLHTDPISQGDPTVKKEVASLAEVFLSSAREANLTLTRTDPGQPLPPASLQSFLKHYNLSGLVITDHKLTYTNKYYNSRYDLPRNIDAQYPDSLDEDQKYNYITPQARHLARVASTLAKALYTLCTGHNDTYHINQTLKANELYVTNLLYCYLYSPRCDLFRTVVDTINEKALEDAKAPYPLYVGVDFVKNVVTKMTLHVLAFITGDIMVNATKTNCTTPDLNDSYSYIWMQGPSNTSGQRNPICCRSLANFSEAISPAFIVDDYDWLSGEYSTWTESIWPEDAMSVRVFVIPSQQQQTVILAVGVILFLILSLLIYAVSSRAEVLFNSRTTEYL